jgi:YaiO family outer membrane protein
MLMPVALLSVAMLAGAQAPDARAQAERLARAGSHREALRQFQALAAANPDDVDARLWIARLHEWMGHPERAVDVYQSIIATHPGHVDALTGLGSALTTMGRLNQAADALNRAESLAADQATVLGAQGRLHARAGRGTLATAYYERALALQPDNAALRADYELLRAHRAHRIEGAYYFEHFNSDAPNTHAGTIELNARVGDAARLFVGGQHARKFSRSETRAGAGFEWTGGDVWFRAGALFGSDTLVLPRADAVADLSYARRRVSWLAKVRYLDFDTDTTWIVSPGITVYPRSDVGITFRYYHSSTHVSDASRSEGNDSVSIEAAGRVSRNVWVNAGYARGFESLLIVTAERLSQFDANVLLAGVRVDPRPMTSFRVAYDHQWRDGDVQVATLLLTLVQRF